MLSVSMLSSYTFCPRSFYFSYVLKLSKPPRAAMILGTIKHKIYELIQEGEKEFVSNISCEEDLNNLEKNYKDKIISITRNAIIKNKFALKSVSIPLSEAFTKIWPTFHAEAEHRTNVLNKFLESNKFWGKELWLNLTPKIKCEYRINSETLNIRGIVDQLEIHPKKLIPVELKSGSMPKTGVWPGHKIQITAYMLLLEDKFKTPISQGIVRYIDAKEDRLIEMTPVLKEEFIKLKFAVMKLKNSPDIPPILNDDKKCTGCGIRDTCFDYKKGC